MRSGERLGKRGKARQRRASERLVAFVASRAERITQFGIPTTPSKFPGNPDNAFMSLAAVIAQRDGTWSLVLLCAVAQRAGNSAAWLHAFGYSNPCGTVCISNPSRPFLP